MPGKDTHIDEQLVSRLKNGEDQAFREIFYLFHKPMYVMALKYLKESQMAEDALQDVFLKLWLNRHLINEDQSIKGFLFTSLKNHLLNVIRNRKTELLKHAALAQKKEIIHTDNGVLMHEYDTLLTNGIERLSPQRQKIFMLRILNGLTNQEISKMLNLSINTVKFQFSQATKSVREYLRKELN